MPKALIVWGGWEGHAPEASANLVADFMRQDGFEVTISNDYDIIASPLVHEVDLFMPIVTGAVPVSAAAIDNLEQAVLGGVGLAGYHAGLSSSFRGHFKFNFMAGSQWVAHPGDIITYEVNITRPDDPVVAGIKDFSYTSEQYYLQIDPAVEVLATTTISGEFCAWRKGVVIPVVYKTTYGKGRVFYSALGHQPSELAQREPQQFLRRGVQWAARGAK